MSKDRYSSPRSRNFPGLGKLTAIRNSPVTAGFAEELVEDVRGSTEADVGARELEAVDGGILVIPDTIDRLLSIDAVLPKTTIVRV